MAVPVRAWPRNASLASFPGPVRSRRASGSVVLAWDSLLRRSPRKPTDGLPGSSSVTGSAGDWTSRSRTAAKRSACGNHRVNLAMRVLLSRSPVFPTSAKRHRLFLSGALAIPLLYRHEITANCVIRLSNRVFPRRFGEVPRLFDVVDNRAQAVAASATCSRRPGLSGHAGSPE